MEDVTMHTNIVGSTETNKSVSYVSNYEEVRKIYRKLSELRKTDPSSKEVQVLIDKYLQHLSNKHHYSYNAFRELGNMYNSSPSLERYLNSYGDGFSEFLSKAINIYCA